MLFLSKILPDSEFRRWITVVGHRDVSSTLASPADLLCGLGQTAPPSVSPPSFVQGMATGHFAVRWEPAVSMPWPKMAWQRWCGAKSEVTYLGPQKPFPAPALCFVRRSETTSALLTCSAQVQVDTEWKHLLTWVFSSVSVEQAAQREL